MRYYFLTLSLGIVLLAGCTKQEFCKSADLCIYNATSDTVEYAIESRYYKLLLNPGDTSCHQIGKMTGGTSYELILETGDGEERTITVDRCQQYHRVD